MIFWQNLEKVGHTECVMQPKLQFLCVTSKLMASNFLLTAVNTHFFVKANRKNFHCEHQDGNK